MRAMHGPPKGIARDRQLLGIRLLRWVSVRRWAKVVAALRRRGAERCGGKLEFGVCFASPR